MSKELFINVTSTEITIAQTEDRKLIGLSREVAQTGFSVGDIYYGTVRKVMPGLNAAFVNIGHERDAFIHYADMGAHFTDLQKVVESNRPGHRALRTETIKLDEGLSKEGKVGDLVKVGDQIMVQIMKEAISTKGPRLTSEISIAGRNIVLIPFTNKVHISQKIRSGAQIKRLKHIAQGVLPKNFGAIMRTAAVEASDLDIEQDILAAVEKWNKTCQAIRKSHAPQLLLGEMNRAATIIRDNLDESYSQIVVDDDSMYTQLRAYVGSMDITKDRIVKLYKGSVPIFDNFDVTRQIKSLFAKYVSLKRGAYLIIETTEAMNVIDVNSGNRTKEEDNQEQTATEVNLVAAAEIARQLRLRDMGGIVIVDFIDMHDVANRQLLYEEMKKLMSVDKAKHTILPLTKFGLMQITRQRIRPLALQDIQDVCPACGGTGKIEPTVLLEKNIENQLSLLTQERKHRYVRLRVSPYIGAYIKRGLCSIRMRWMCKFRTFISIVEDKSVGMVDVHYQNQRGEDILHTCEKSKSKS